MRGAAQEQQDAAGADAADKIAEVDLFMAFKYFHKQED